MEPYYQTGNLSIYHGNSLSILKELPSESVNCCVTSPPYWGLRDYGTAEWSGGDAQCDHKGRSQTSGASTLGEWKNGGGQRYKEETGGMPFAGTCGKCGAVRVDHQLGLEKTPDEYVANMVAVFAEVRRVLRDDGTLWLNVGDSYAAQGGDHAKSNANQLNVGAMRCHANGSENKGTRKPTSGLKPKDLVGIPWMLAFALRADGWYLRQDIVWSKPNPMPESVTDRCTKAHEYLFLLSKSPRYYYNQEAILEDVSPGTHDRLSQNVQAQIGSDRAHAGRKSNGNMKAVGRHLPGNKNHKGTTAYENGDEKMRTKAGLVDYAVKMRKLAEAGSGTKNNESFDAAMAIMPDKRNKRSVWTVATQPYSEAHFATFPEALIEPCILAGCPVGGTVLDPFGGSMTTLKVARDLQCKGVAIELNAEYIEIGKRRLVQEVFQFGEVTK